MTDSLEETRTIKPQRDERGRLLPGFSGNPNGRPKGSQRADFYEWAEGRHEKWLERIEEAAKDDWRAAAFLVEHKIGKPQQSVELDDKREPPAIDAIRELQTHLRRIK